jgi:hypothetical protein
MKRTLAAAAAATVALLLALPGPASAVPETPLRPAALDRGPDVRIPHLEGHTVVDGDIRIPVRAGAVRLLGTSGRDYVVGTSDRSGTDHFRVLRLSADGGRRVVLRGVPMWDVRLSGDGTQLARAGQGLNTVVKVWDSRTGDLQAHRRFHGSVSILDLDESRMVLGAWDPDRTFWWNTVTDSTRRIVGQPGYAAQISADRVATLTGDPYDGGCSVVRSLRHPGTPVWRSCDRRVQVFSPGSGRTATIPILTDGLGSREVWLQAPGGRVLAHYTARLFGALQWESDRALLLETDGARKAATVRCVVRDCERASALRPVQTP